MRDKVALIKQHRPKALTLARACELLKLSRSAYYYQVDRPDKLHMYDAQIEAACKSCGIYGYRRIKRTLEPNGVKIGFKRVMHDMKRLGLSGGKKPKRVRTTVPVPVDAENLLLTHAPQAPGQVLAADATWVPMGGRRGLYLAVVIDLYTRQALGFAWSNRLDTKLTLKALAHALQAKEPTQNWIHHSDRGSTYASADYRMCVLSSGGTSSFTKPAKPQQNGAMESFFKTLKHEEIHRNEYSSPEHLIRAVEDYVRFYNRIRMHSSIGYEAPDQFARSYHT